MTPLTLAVIFASPAMFPDHSPLAVWIGMGCIAEAATIRKGETP